MSYSALARKWRPKSFSELKGQDYVTKALINALTRDQLHHAYLFTGTRGVGKTTIARIFAKCLNCEQGVVAVPCGQCQACMAIDNGRFLDLIEVDAASKTKVEDTRDLLENVQYAPSSGRYKVYLIDEVHMLSGHSFNALLKTLEEPPAHVKFILATTDPQKIPATILSRCLNFHLRAISETEIKTQLAYILDQEQQTYDEGALTLIAQFAKGSMRDALSLLEQAISVCQESIELQAVEGMLGMQYRQYLNPLLDAIVTQDTPSAIKLVETMLDAGAQAEDVIASLLSRLYNDSLQFFSADLEKSTSRMIEIGAAQLAPEAVQLLYQIGLNGQRDLPYAPNPRIGLEMTILRMIAFIPEKNAMQTKPAQHTQQSVRTKPATQAPSAQHQHASQVVISKQAPKKQSEPKGVQPEANKETNKAHGSQQALPAPWNEMIDALPLVGLTKILLKHCTVRSWGEKQIHLSLERSQEACLNDSRRLQIQKALSDYLKNEIIVHIACTEQDTIMPIEQDKQKFEKNMQNAKAQLLSDENVQTIMKTFDATLENVISKETK